MSVSIYLTESMAPRAKGATCNRKSRTFRELKGALIGSILTSIAGLAAIGSFAPDKLDIPETFDGVSSEGSPVAPPAISEPEYKPLETRVGGKWGNPGYKPFRGDNYSALRLMGLPKPQALELVSRITAHASEGEIIFSNSGVRDREGIYKFSPYYAMTFGNTVSFATRTNFKGGEFQRAERFTVTLEGKPVVFAVPYVCGNVTRLNIVPEDTSNVIAARPVGYVATAEDGVYQLGYVDGFRAAMQQISPKTSAPVPEPGTWTLMLIGLALLAQKLRKPADKSSR